MATLIEFTIPADEFPLGDIFREFPDVRVELERVVPTTESTIPYFWVLDADPAKEERIEAAFRDRPDVKGVELIDEVDGDYLLRVEWKPAYRGILKAIGEANVTILSGTGSANNWTFEVRGDDREDVAAFQERCTEYGIPITVTALHSLASVQSAGEYDLTDTQREALLLAYERGYFETPREASLEEIAGELGITRQSLASRLRRGHRRLIRDTLASA